MINIQQLFEKYEDECSDFNKITTKLSTRSDLHAFLLLEQILPKSPHKKFWIAPFCTRVKVMPYTCGVLKLQNQIAFFVSMVGILAIVKLKYLNMMTLLLKNA